MATLEQRMGWLAERLRKLAVEAKLRRNRHSANHASWHSENAVVDCYNYAARAIDIELAQADTVAQPEQVVPFSSQGPKDMNPPQLDAEPSGSELRRYSAGVLTTVYAEALCPSAARDAMLEALADAEEAAALKCVELEWELSECLEDEGEGLEQ